MRVLLVDEPLATELAVYGALSRLGEVQAAEHSEAIPALLKEYFDLVIVDATNIDNIGLFVARIHFQKLCPCVVVVVRESSWRLVRDVFRAGAADCLGSDAPSSQWKASLSEVLHLDKDFVIDPMRESHEQSYHTSG